MSQIKNEKLITVTKIITAEDDLSKVVDEINLSRWDQNNDMCAYDADSLQAYLKRQDTLFVVCHEITDNRATLLGIASCRVEIKPYEKARWLYVDEVDVCADQRQKGAGAALMQKLLEIAKQEGCEELWLGTEPDNHAANALYKSLQPDDTDNFVGYTYKVDC